MDLVGAAEIRKMLGGLSKQRVYQITSHRNFPEPVAELVQGKVWLRADVIKYLERYRPELLQEDGGEQ